jgi:hypothetical protein
VSVDVRALSRVGPKHGRRGIVLGFGSVAFAIFKYTLSSPIMLEISLAEPDNSSEAIFFRDL